MAGLLNDLLAMLSGGLVGVVLGVVGGGGSILAVPLLVYVVGVQSPHVAIGSSAVAVSASALGNLVAHWRLGNVKWRCAAVFSAAGVIGALAGSAAAQAVDGHKLLSLFGAVMVAVGLFMLRKRGSGGDHGVRLTPATARTLLPMLLGIGLAVGLMSGFFGIGGGFLIVPGLMLATRMPLNFAIGTSLVAVSAFGATTASSYAIAGLVDWRLALVFIAGGVLGGFAGSRMGKELAKRRHVLGVTFASLVIVVGSYILIKGVSAWSA
ncbi:sulfite exporter TauE/SafE family protein [Alsobacter sp. SYSU M60028]|uniref:Probable membrane transporter protein n=1 Tax=Alsobacter ponti TaxID=2962936 RepID=A0ABT1LE44_9HYPH|nr:sulfite exporter TauE/SafE family protein [Alsobacter ponti]MCP8939699.1 sulfite exporter TauE/SafE family protein [Alsobacter ponti]